jgi:hypothetical protein
VPEQPSQLQEGLADGVEPDRPELVSGLLDGPRTFGGRYNAGPMFDPQMHLLSSLLASLVDGLEGPEAAADGWSRASLALTAAGVDEPDLLAAVAGRDAAGLRAIVESWRSDKRLLKRALKAYRKSFKVTRLDAESSLGGGPFSGGRRSGISGITPPPRYPREVWEELARQGRLIACGHGVYELPPE